MPFRAYSKVELVWRPELGNERLGKFAHFGCSLSIRIRAETRVCALSSGEVDDSEDSSNRDKSSHLDCLVQRIKIWRDVTNRIEQENEDCAFIP